MTLILASTSPIRRQMLDAAGVSHEARPPDCDEAAIKAGFEGAAEDLAIRLASAKALSLDAKDWVVGSDSLVACAGRRFDKPADREQAGEHLRFFSGRTIELTSAVALAKRGEIAWQHGETARLHVRELSDQFIDDYLAAEWPDVAYCVGVFRMEGRGVQLFDRIDGSHFTILGMPLLPLLEALRSRGMIAS